MEPLLIELLANKSFQPFSYYIESHLEIQTSDVGSQLNKVY